eukprot:evm.model.scf_219.9 EVM.evm.TU.scf_219.9   scf_219:83670-88488(-)
MIVEIDARGQSARDWVVGQKVPATGLPLVAKYNVALVNWCAAAARTVNLLVVTSKDAPELEVLKGLPDNVHIMATGRTMEELAHMEGQWDSVEAMLLCGLLKNFTTKDTLKELFSKVKNLKWMHVATAGVDHLLFPELVESDVALTNAQGAYSHSLAEYAITACNWFAKDLPRMRAAQKAKKWDVFDVEELRGSTMGVVGLGDIGSACARLGRAFKMNVVGLRRNVQMSEEEQREGLVDKIYPPEELCSLMSTSDYVVAALPMTPHTNKFINREAIQAMKPNGVFINVGRGKTVDEQALIEALQQNAIRGAGLDVFETEPLPEDSPLYTLDNVLMSAHCADRTAMFQHDSLGIFVDIAKQYVSTGELRNVVDKRSGY